MTDHHRQRIINEFCYRIQSLTNFSDRNEDIRAGGDQSRHRIDKVLRLPCLRPCLTTNELIRLTQALQPATIEHCKQKRILRGDTTTTQRSYATSSVEGFVLYGSLGPTRRPTSSTVTVLEGATRNRSSTTNRTIVVAENDPNDHDDSNRFVPVVAVSDIVNESMIYSHASSNSHADHHHYDSDSIAHWLATYSFIEAMTSATTTYVTTSMMVRIRQLDLGLCHLSSEHAYLIGRAIQHPNCSLQQLRLSFNPLIGITTTSTSYCCTADNNNDNNDHDQNDQDGWCSVVGGIQAIAKGLSLNTSLRKLELRETGIDRDGCQAIVNALIMNRRNTQLQQLDLSRNIGVGGDDDGVFAIHPFASLIQANIPSLQELNLSGTDISNITCTAISLALRYNNQLQCLNLECNRISCPPPSSVRSILFPIMIGKRSSDDFDHQFIEEENDERNADDTMMMMTALQQSLSCINYTLVDLKLGYNNENGGIAKEYQNDISRLCNVNWKLHRLIDSENLLYCVESMTSIARKRQMRPREMTCDDDLTTAVVSGSLWPHVIERVQIKPGLLYEILKANLPSILFTS